MSSIRLAPSASFFVFVLGCTGLDPEAFGSGGPAGAPEVAGWSFDAGVDAAPGGRAGAAAAARGGKAATSGSAVSSGEGGASEGGAMGTDDGATGGTEGGAESSGGGVEAAGGRPPSGGGGTTRGGAGGAGGAAGRAPGGGAAGSAESGAAGRAGSGGALPAVHAVFFSEYVEGSSSYKALELQAREASTLSGCRLVTYFNGSSSGSGISLDGTIAAGAVTTLCSTALATVAAERCARATNLTFNGDDAVALECAGELLDVIGQIGVDPGDAWTSAEASTLNQTLRRRCSASAGDPNGSDAFDPSGEWTSLATDTFDGLGVAECPPN